MGKCPLSKINRCFSILAAIVLTRSLFHLVWIVELTSWLFVFIKNRRKQTLLVSSLLVLLAIALYMRKFIFIRLFREQFLAWDQHIQTHNHAFFRRKGNRFDHIRQTFRTGAHAAIQGALVPWAIRGHPEIQTNGRSGSCSGVYRGAGHDWNNAAYLSLSRMRSPCSGFILPNT